jgi:Tat protein translocase TatB subunit
MFGTLGGSELFLILVIALIVFGPRKLPDIGKSIGKMLVEFRRASNDFKRTIEDEVEADKLRTAMEAEPKPAPALAPAPDPAAPGTLPEQAPPVPEPVPGAVEREAAVPDPPKA